MTVVEDPWLESSLSGQYLDHGGGGSTWNSKESGLSSQVLASGQSTHHSTEPCMLAVNSSAGLRQSQIVPVTCCTASNCRIMGTVFQDAPPLWVCCRFSYHILSLNITVSPWEQLLVLEGKTSLN